MLKIEMQNLQREKDQSKKDFEELQKAMERNEVERKELNNKVEKVERDRRCVFEGVLVFHIHLEIVK